MPQHQIRMTYASPERTRMILVGGRPLYEREPNHPTRPAREYEYNAWWETITPEQAERAAKRGYAVRVA